MSMGMLIVATLEWAKAAMKGFQRLGSSQHGHPFRFMIAFVHSVPTPLPICPMFTIFPRITQNGGNTISMVLADIYGSIPEGFS